MRCSKPSGNASTKRSEPLRLRRRRSARLRAALAGAFVLLASAQPNAGRRPGSDPAACGDVPFEPGEKLVFHVEWSPPWYLFFLPTMDAGEVRLALEKGPELEQKPSMRIVFTAKSSGTLARLTGVHVDDYFESYVDACSLCTASVTKRIREGRRKRDIDVTYLPASNQLRIREVNVAASPPKVDRDSVLDDIPSCVKDIFSAVYDTRRRNLAEGFAHRVLVGEDDKIREIEARVERREDVKLPLGRFDAWKVDTVSVLGGLFKDGGQFKIWMTADERRLPVKFEARVRLGKVVGTLKEATPPPQAPIGRSRP